MSGTDSGGRGSEGGRGAARGVPAGQGSEKGNDPVALPTHCPRLGGTVTLGYCLAPAQEAPCDRILDCWWEVFDIQRFLEQNVPEGLRSRIGASRRMDRLDLILDTIRSLTNQKVT